MGNCYNKCIIYTEPPNSLIYEKIRKPSFGENYNVEAALQRCSNILDEDKEHLFENEEWYNEIAANNNGKPLLDIHKFMESYPHYRIDQVI